MPAEGGAAWTVSIEGVVPLESLPQAVQYKIAAEKNDVSRKNFLNGFGFVCCFMCYPPYQDSEPATAK